MRRVTVVGCVAVLALVGCTDRTSQAKAEEKLCTETAELDGTITRIAAVDPANGTVAQLKTLKTELDTQYREVREAAEDVGSLRIDSVTRAYEHMVRVINGVNDQAGLAAADAEIDQAAGEMSDARIELNMAARC